MTSKKMTQKYLCCFPLHLKIMSITCAIHIQGCTFLEAFKRKLNGTNHIKLNVLT